MYGWFLLCNVAAPKSSKAAGRSFFRYCWFNWFLYDLCNFGMFDGCSFCLWNMWPLLLFYQLLVLLLLFYFKCCLLMFHLFRTQYNHAVHHIHNEAVSLYDCTLYVVNNSVMFGSRFCGKWQRGFLKKNTNIGIFCLFLTEWESDPK